MKNADMPAMPTDFEIADLGFVGVSNVSDSIKFNSGLTKREYAAIKIMAGFASAPDIEVNLEQASKFSVAWADALLKELEK